MKKAVFLFLVSSLSYTLYAQQGENNNMPDTSTAHWCIDVNVKGGLCSQNLNIVNFVPNYLNALNDTISKLKYSNAVSYGFDAQLAYFFGKKRQFGLGTGISALWQQGDITLDKFHVEYQSTDAQSPTNLVFRQVLSANSAIKETIHSNSISIPLLLKYKKQFSSRLGFSADAGVLFKVQMKNSYSTNASFDYEAIYKYAVSGGTATAVYDNASTPGSTDQFITRSQVSKEASQTDLQAHFDSLRSQGYNVGLNQSPNTKTGTLSYTSSVAYIVQTAITFRLNDNLYLDAGFYYIMQSFDNSANNKNYMLTDKIGEYNSLMNSVNTINNNLYGLNIGLRILLDKKLATLLPGNAPLK